MRNSHGLCVVSYHRPWVLDIFSKYASWRWLIGLVGFAKLSCQTPYHFAVLKYDIKQECCQTWAARFVLYWTFNTSMDELSVDLFIVSFRLYWSENYENPYLFWSFAANGWKLVLCVHVLKIRVVWTELSYHDLKWLAELGMKRRLFCSFLLPSSSKYYPWQFHCQSSFGDWCCNLVAIVADV